MNPYCFVITSFGEKPNLKDLQSKFDARNLNDPIQKINFDKIYEDLVEPAIKKAGLTPLIEREENNMGVIQKTMYEKIILCEFCVADLTNANPNVYYELGMRYAVKPFTTIPIIASSHFPLPFDIGFNRTFAYQVDAGFNLVNKDKDIEALTKLLLKAKETRSTDSPLYDMVNGIAFQNSVAHEKTDVFRDQVIYDKQIKSELAYARGLTDPDESKAKQLRIDAINAVINKYYPLQNMETAILVDIMISFRDIFAFDEMLAFIKTLPRYVFKTIMVQEQYAFALNRVGGKRKPAPDEVMISEAESVLKDLETDGKASSETYGIWGRIYKDKMDRAYTPGNLAKSKIFLEKALAQYKKGFEADLRDAYPGVNYATCLELSGDRKTAARLIPAVENAVLTKMARKDPDYWDYATLLELAVIEERYDAAKDYLERARALNPWKWMLETTQNNLSKIIVFRKERKEDTAGVEEIVTLLA